MSLYVWLPVFANRFVMKVYLRKLPVMSFDILNGQHEHKLGTFTFSPVFDSRLLRSLLALGRLFLQSKHFGSGFDIFLHRLTVTSCNHCISECNFFLRRFPRRFLRPAKRRPRETKSTHIFEKDVKLMCSILIFGIIASPDAFPLSFSYSSTR